MATYSTLIAIIYSSVYGSVIIGTSIYCLLEEIAKRKSKKESTESIYKEIETQIELNEIESKNVEEANMETANIEIDEREFAKKNDGNLLKLWVKSVWSKKSIYWAVVPHIFDQATDFGLIYEYYQGTSWNKGNDTVFDTKWFFIFSLFTIIFQRFVSTITIYTMTKNIKCTILQFLDLLIIKAIWVNYSLGLDEPCNPQRYIQILEACFESSPQILLSTSFILKSSFLNRNISEIAILSTLFSLWSLTSKIASDDKGMFPDYHDSCDNPDLYRNLKLRLKSKPPFIFFNWQYFIRVILWRFFEISSRVCVCVLFWINLGGLALLIVLGMEITICLILSFVEKTPDIMGNLMYISFGFREGYVMLFWLYRILSFYLYIILITIFSSLNFNSSKVPNYQERHNITIQNSLGFAMLIYAWIAGCIWPYIFFWLEINVMQGSGIMRISWDDEDNLQGGFSTRDLIFYIETKQFNEARQLLKFGYMPKNDYPDKNGQSRTLLGIVCDLSNDVGLINDCFTANPKQLNQISHGSETPVMLAASKRHIDAVKYLLSKGVETYHQNTYGDRLIHILCARIDNIALIAQYISNHPEEVNDKDESHGSHGTPIMRAAYAENRSTVKYLLQKAKAETHHINELGNTLLHILCEKQYDRCIDLLKEVVQSNRKLLDMVGRWGRTPIMMAAYWDHPWTVQYLLSEGADIRNIDEKGNTLLHCACYGSNNVSLVQLCFEANMEQINMVNKDGKTPIMMVGSKTINVIKGHYISSNSVYYDCKNGGTSRIIQYLLHVGAETHQKDKKGKSLLDHCKFQHENIPQEQKVMYFNDIIERLTKTM
eukprot:208295_1